VGDIRLGENVSIWYNAVLRGDINYIEIGDGTNIQDGCILHLENNRPCILGANVTVGHNAIVHGCVVEDGCMIGMGAVILDGAVVKKGAIVGAGCVVKENTVVPENHLIVGVPGRVVREETGSYDRNVKWAKKYIELAKIHSTSQVSPPV